MSNWLDPIFREFNANAGDPILVANPDGLLPEDDIFADTCKRGIKLIPFEDHDAFRTGFKKTWQERDYATIIIVASKIPETILQEDPKLLMWYDQALTRSGEDE